MQLFSGSRALKPAGLILVLLCLGVNPARGESNWAVARDAHFEVYSQTGAASAEAALARFEQLRAFFLAQGFPESAEATRLRVIGFASEAAYSAFRLRPAADAYYAALGEQQYIVLPGLDAHRYKMAAHEYAHAVLHAGGLRLPLWLGEGLAEYFSTVRMNESRVEIGGDLPARSQTLARQKWIPPALLFSAGSAWLAQQSAIQNAVFYAESWAVTDLLIAHPSYSAHFGDFVHALDRGLSSADALAQVYGISPAALVEAAHAEKPVARAALAMSAAPEHIETAGVSDYEIHFVLADLLAADGELKRAAAAYCELLAQKPEDANTYAALGNVALRAGDKEEALRDWHTAIEKGVSDAALCYRYAQLAGEQGVAEDRIRPALERAIALEPDFDDARYALALIESNAGDFAAALEQLHAMHEPGPQRAFAYWSAIAYAATELNRRAEAERAASRALEHAATPAERHRALEAAYIAETDLTVRFARDANGEARLETARVPHGTSDFNPFI